MRHTIYRTAVVAALGLSTTPASAYIAYIDDLLIMRSNNTGTALLTYFHDPFSDGFPPPVAEPGNNPALCGGSLSNCYGVAASFPAGSETGGKLKLDTAFGAPSANAVGTPTMTQRVRLATSRADSTAMDSPGLQIGRSFSASAVFDLVVPGPGDSFALRFTDVHVVADPPASGNQNDFLQLMVRMGTLPSSIPVIEFRKQNFQSPGTITTIEVTPLDLTIEADQIMLKLDHATAGSDNVFASWAYLNNGVVVQPGQFLTAGTIFTGESWTRVDFTASSVVTAVPEPETYAMLLAGLGLIGWRLRSRMRLV